MFQEFLNDAKNTSEIPWSTKFEKRLYIKKYPSERLTEYINILKPSETSYIKQQQ